jgi:hypothetical protein
VRSGKRSGVGRTLARVLVLVAGLLVLTAIVAGAAELNTAELDGTANNVTVEQGQTVQFSISLWATGTIRCTATSSNPATAKVDTVYNVSATGSVTSNTPSDPVPFYADPFCSVTWPGAPAKKVVTAAVHIDGDTPTGDYAVSLHTVTTTPVGSGSALNDVTPTVVTFHVIPGTDRTPPAVNCSGPVATAGTNGWYTTAVAYNCTASDLGSGLADPADTSFSLETTGDGSVSTPSKTVADKRGNTTTAGPFGPFNIDTVAPLVTCGSPTGATGSNGWYVSAVSVSCTGADATSGLADPSDAAFTLSTAGEGARSIPSRTVSDVAGWNVSTDTYGPFNVDLNDPSVSLSSPADGAVYILGSAGTADYSCDDTAAGSGLDTCVGSVASGGELDTSTVGTKTVTVTATDVAGRTTTVTHSYEVVYEFSGQFQTGNGRDVPKAGSALPAWFSLNGVSDPHAVGGLYSAQITCGSTATAPLGTAITMAGGLRYDPANDRFAFVWKSDRSWAGTCRQLQIVLNDGTTHTVPFDFK